MNFSKPKGTYDVLPKESARWQNVESLIREICSIFNYKEIRTPMFESTQLYHRSAGETSDVVSKETYDFKDRGDRSMTLRPEGTAGVVRSYIENKYNVFTDDRFSDATCTLKVYTQLYHNYNLWLYNVTRRSKSITVRLLSISEAEFRYLKALNTLESGNYEEALMEPVMIPSNVKGGLGFVGISSETRMTMQLPDEIIDNENLPPYTQ